MKVCSRTNWTGYLKMFNHMLFEDVQSYGIRVTSISIWNGPNSGLEGQIWMNILRSAHSLVELINLIFNVPNRISVHRGGHEKQRNGPYLGFEGQIWMNVALCTSSCWVDQSDHSILKSNDFWQSYRADTKNKEMVTTWVWTGGFGWMLRSAHRLVELINLTKAFWNPIIFGRITERTRKCGQTDGQTDRQTGNSYKIKMSPPPIFWGDIKILYNNKSSPCRKKYANLSTLISTQCVDQIHVRKVQMQIQLIFSFFSKQSLYWLQSLDISYLQRGLSTLPHMLFI